MGNVGIAGHRDTFFHKLQHIHRHDIIILVTARNTYRYWVQCTMVVDPTCTEVLNKTSKPALTLVTCYPFNYLGPAPKRFIVRAQRMDS
jgi:sortase A